MSTATTTAPPSSHDRTQQFVANLKDCWHRLPNKGLFFSLLGAWLLMLTFYGNASFGYVDTRSLLYWMYDAYTAPVTDDGHGLLIPPVVLYLFYVRRNYLLASPMRVWWPGLLILLAACLMHVVGYTIQQQRPSILALLVGIYGIMGVAWGPVFLRRAFFPFWILIFLIPISSIAEQVTVPLRVLVSESVSLTCRAFGMEVECRGTQLLSPDKYAYEVAPACSGLRSLIATFALATIYGFTFFRKPWKQWLLVFSSVPLALLGNMVRMLAIILAAEWFGAETGNYVHESTFWSLLPYVPAILGLILIGRWIEEDDPDPAEVAAQPAQEPKP